MQKVKVFDLPTRAFHALFGILFVVSFTIGNFVDDDSWLYAYHMLSGLGMTFLVLLRVIWGVAGTKHARFSSFNLSPKDLIDYFKSALTGKTKRELRHNPASSYASIFMFLLTFGLAASGLLMINGFGEEFFEEVHKLFAFAFLLTVLFHVAGVLFHHIRHRDGILLSMVNGKKETVEGESPISGQAPIAFVLFIALTAGFSAALASGYDSNQQTLSLFGEKMRLGEQDNEPRLEYDDEYDEYDDDD